MRDLYWYTIRDILLGAGFIAALLILYLLKNRIVSFFRPSYAFEKISDRIYTVYSKHKTDDGGGMVYLIDENEESVTEQISKRYFDKIEEKKKIRIIRKGGRVYKLCGVGDDNTHLDKCENAVWRIKCCYEKVNSVNARNYYVDFTNGMENYSFLINKKMFYALRELNGISYLSVVYIGKKLIDVGIPEDLQER